MDTVTHHEGSPWFWKLFGGGIIGLIGVLLMLIINNLNFNVSSVRSDLMNIVTQQKTDNEIQISRFKDEMILIRTQMAEINEFKNATKEKIVDLEKDIREVAKHLESTIIVSRDHDKECDASVAVLKEKVLSLEEKVDKLMTK